MFYWYNDTVFSQNHNDPHKLIVSRENEKKFTHSTSSGHIFILIKLHCILQTNYHRYYTFIVYIVYTYKRVYNHKGTTIELLQITVHSNIIHGYI